MTPFAGAEAGGLSLRQISKRFGAVEVVNSLSLHVRRGMIYGLLGPNGAGKTTTLRMIMGILLPDHGTVLRDGEPAGPMDRRRMGYLPEARGLYARMGVAEQLAFFAALRGITSSDVRPAVARWLDLLGLRGLSDRRSDELSHGMQQLLQLAIALIHDPDVVILDEPFTGLDPVHVARVIELISSLKDQGVAVLLTTHAMEQAEAVCDHVGFLDHGTLRAEGTPDDLRSRYGMVALRVVYRDAVPLDLSLPDDMRTEVQGRGLTVEWSSGRPPHDVIARLDAAGQMTEFELRRPGLREVFLRVVQ